MCQRSTCSVRGIFVDICRGISEEGYQTRYDMVSCWKTEVEKWQWLIVSMWNLFEISEEIAVYAYGNASNFKLEEPRCFYGNSIRFSEEKCCRV